MAEHAFAESSLHLTARLLSGEWALLREEDGRYHSRLAHHNTALPLTALQKAWIRSLLADRRMQLFLEDDELAKLQEQYCDVAPLFLPEDFHIFDISADGDDYGDDGYVGRFRLAMRALQEGHILQVRYEPPRDVVLELTILPQRMLYSAKDDKFRLECLRLTGTQSRQIILNMARIHRLELVDGPLPAFGDSGGAESNKYTVSIAISDERNALERCMLQFASYDKQTVWDEAREKYLCDISYNPMEETELLIRLLSFGPVIEVLGPNRFLRQIQRRIRMQLERMA